MELVAFLRARLDEDQQAAQEAAEQVGDGQWEQRNVRIVTTADRDRDVAEDVIYECIEHIARHDPARVLAEVNAKRRIIDLHEPDEFERDRCKSCRRDESGWEGSVPAEWPCATLRLLALPYADHADYREEWRP